MRLEVLLKPERWKFLIPINYNYPLSAAIYKVFANSGPNFTKWLHKRGFSLDDGKRFKFFNFSRLYFEKMEVHNDTILAEGVVKFYLSSPVEDTLVLNFINGLLSLKALFIGNQNSGTTFKVIKASIAQVPEFVSNMNFIMLSPTVATIKEMGRITYLLPDSPYIEDALKNNLKSKFNIFNHKVYNDYLEIFLDHNYIQKNGGAQKVAKLITIKEGADNQAKIKGFLTPLKIIGNTDIIKLAYYTGIGEKNSLGFGAIEVSKKQ